MIDLFKGFFKKETSSQTAKDRLRLVLMSDHLALAPDVIAALKADLLAVISRYVEIDPSLADVTFESRERDVAMLASIPILSVRDRDPRTPPPGGGGGTLASGGGNAASPPREASRATANAAPANAAPASARQPEEQQPADAPAAFARADDAPAAFARADEPVAAVAETAAAPEAAEAVSEPAATMTHASLPATLPGIDAAAPKPRAPRRRRRRKPRVKIASVPA